jgi:hypothetical protein
LYAHMNNFKKLKKKAFAQQRKQLPEETAWRMEESLCQLFIWQGIHIQSI